MKTLVTIAAGCMALAFFAGPAFDTSDRTLAASTPIVASDAPVVPDTGTRRPQNGGEASLSRDGNGHFSGSATINGRAVAMLIDSGASLVVLSRADAVAAGVEVRDDRFTGTARTANGAVAVMPVTLSSVRIGDVERRDVAAAVIDGDLPAALIGQSFLSRVDDVTISGDVMRLR